MRVKAAVWMCAVAVMGVGAMSCGAQAAANGARRGSLTGKWQVTAEFYGTPTYGPLQLEQTGEKLTGNFHGEKLEGTVEKGDGGEKVHFVAKDSEGDTDEVTATVVNGEMKGEVVSTGSGNPTGHDRIPFTATLIKPIVRGNETHEFVPTVFYRSWSPMNKPVLRVKPGDTIHTTTVDAGGTDEKGQRRVMGGNPATGPFYIEGAMPGDTLAVHIVRLKLNRDWAISDDDVVSRATDGELTVRFKDAGKTVRWKLDRVNGTASVETPGEHMKTLHNSGAADAGVRGDGGGTAAGSSADGGLWKVWREHGLQRDWRGSDGVSAGFKPGGAAVLRRCACSAG